MAGHFYPPPPTFIGGRQPYAPRLGQAQSGPVPSAPPPNNRGSFRVIEALYGLPPFSAQLYVRRLGQVQSGPTPSASPPINRASLRIIEARYREDPWTIIYVCSIAPLLQTPAVPDNPPPRSYANQRLILGQWEPPNRPLPYTIKVAPLLPPAVVPDNPPRFSYSIRNTILALWDPPYRPIPRLQLSEIVTEAPPDTTPDQFSLTDQSGVARSSTITSAAITVQGITAAAAITVTGGTYDINGSGTFVSTPGTVNNGDTVRARHTSSASYSTPTNTVVTIGGVSGTFTSITIPDPAARARTGGLGIRISLALR